MRTKPAVPLRHRAERGQALAYTGIFMLVFMGIAVVGVDVGRLAFTAAEVQSVADAAATAAMGYAAKAHVDPTTVARDVIEKNNVDGRVATLGGGSTDIIKSIVPGTFDFNTSVFTPNGGNWTTATAAKAHGSARVNNLVAPVFGATWLQSDVDRDAIAAVSGSCHTVTVMPIALGECFFTQFETSNPPNCSLLPTLVQVPNIGNTCWTSLVNGNANQGDVTKYFPTQCCGNGNTCGLNSPPPPVHVGSSIGVINGQVDPVLKVIEDCFNQGLTEWDIPVIPCGSCNQSATVVGFAHIRISAVRPTGGNKGIDLVSLCRTDPSTGGGCVNVAGLTGVTLVQ